MVDTFLQYKRIGLGIDRMTLAQKSIQANQTASFPVVYYLGPLCQYVTGQPPTVSRRALADVKATIAVLFHQIFWENWSKYIFTFGRPEEEADAVAVVPPAEQQPSLLQDSDTSVSRLDSATTVYDSTGETLDSTHFESRLVIYTGKSTYHASSEWQEKKKAVQVVKQLVEPFVGTYQTIYTLTVSTGLWIYSSHWRIEICRAVQIQTKVPSKDRPQIVRRMHDHESNTIQRVM
jgi:hypothetical protein